MRRYVFPLFIGSLTERDGFVCMETNRNPAAGFARHTKRQNDGKISVIF